MPLEQVSNNITFYAFFVSSKQGVTGLTVTADLYRNGTAILTAQACTAVGGGLYSYTLPSANVNAEGEYICLFKTASTAVDQQHIPAIWCVAKAGVEYLDAQVTSRMPTGNVTVGGYASTYDPGYGVWTYLTTNPQTANSFGDAVKTNLTAYTTTRAAKLDNLDTTISSRSALIASDIWNYLTSSAIVAGSIGKRIADNLDTTISSRGTSTLIASNIWDAATSGLTTVGSVGKRLADYVDAAVSSRLATSGYTAPDNTSIGTILSRTDVATSTRASGADYTTARAANLDNLDAAISSRLAPAGITSLQADVTAIKTPVVANVDATISSRLASSAYTPTTAMSADVATILSRTDVATSTRASGADYTTARAAKLDNLDAAISSRLAPAGITSMQADVTAIKTPVVANLDAAITSRADKTYYTNARAARLDRLDIDVSAIISSTSGIGSNEYVTTILNPATGAPLDGVATWVTADAAGDQFIAGTRHTDGQGKVTYMLDYGTYYMWFQLNGWEFNNPTQFTVA